MPKSTEREDMIGFLLSRLDARDILIAQLRQQIIEAGQKTASETTTEHPSMTGPSRPLTGE